MADTKVSALPAADPLTGAELAYVVQGGASKRSTAAAIAALAEPAVYVALGNSSGTATVDCANGAQVTGTMRLTGNVTLAPSNVPSGRLVTITLRVVQDGTGGRTLTFPTNTTILNGGDGSIAGGANQVSVVTLVTADGGSTWLAVVADVRPTQYESFYLNPPADGNYYITFTHPVTLNLGGASKRGLGTTTIGYAKSTDGTSFTTVTGSQSFAANNVLRVNVTGFNTWLALTIPRTA